MIKFFNKSFLYLISYLEVVKKVLFSEEAFAGRNVCWKNFSWNLYNRNDLNNDLNNVCCSKKGIDQVEHEGWVDKIFFIYKLWEKAIFVLTDLGCWSPKLCPQICFLANVLTFPYSIHLIITNADCLKY